MDPAQPEQFIQCPNGPDASLISNGDNPCIWRLQGQTWTAPENGYLTGFQCKADSTEELGIQLVVHDGHIADSVLYSTSLPPSTGTSCSGDNDTWRTFHFDSIPLQQGRQYRFEFTQGDALAQCGNGYPDGVVSASASAHQPRPPLSHCLPTRFTRAIELGLRGTYSLQLRPDSDPLMEESVMSSTAMETATGPPSS